MRKHYVTLLLLAITMVLTSTAQTQAATPGECEVLQRANPNIQCDENTVITDTDRALGISNKVAEDKAFLLQNARDLRGSKAPPTCPANIYRLNNTFAVCLSRFIKAANSRYGDGTVTVVSAFRSPDPGDACGNNKAAGGAPGSNHQYGRAADVAPGNGLTLENLQDFAKANPQFGVCFPYVPRLTSGSFYDPPHMALAGIDTGEARYCAQQGITNYCDQSPAYDPSQIYDYATPSTGDSGRQISDTTQPYQYDNNPYSAPLKTYDAYQEPQGSYGYAPQPAYVVQPYTPAQYSGIYGDQFTPPTSKFDQLIADNPDDYYIPTDDESYADGETTTPNTTTPNTTNTDYTNSNISRPTGTQAVSLTNPLGGKTLPTQNGETFPTNPDSIYDPSTITNSQQYGDVIIPTEGAEEAWLAEAPYNNDNASNNLPSFIPFYGQEQESTPDPYDLYAQSQDTPDWVDNSFNDTPQPKSWWQKFISIFGF